MWQCLGLQELYAKYKEQGLTVLAFPCNQFGQQEPNPCPDIKAFAEKNYKVSFPMFSKVESAIQSQVEW